MARIQFNSLMEEIVGKYAGSVFQDSYIGLQIRTRVTPRNPQTNFQQLRRGEFGFISSLWRRLTALERATWEAATATLPDALRLFISSNVNLSLINEPIISSYPGATTPAAFPLSIVQLGAGLLDIEAASALAIVPAGQSLLFYATYEKAVTKIFTNPSQYSPIAIYPTGTDFSTTVSAGPAWENQFGVMHNDQRLCIKSVLIDVTNGSRGPESFQCENEPVVSTFKIIDSDGTFIIDAGGTFVVSQ